MYKIQTIMHQYNKVFDDNGNVKACGREACKDLISMCKTVDPNTDFGNPISGMMNVDNIKAFRKKHFLTKK